jgi:hypothetical protein
MRETNTMRAPNFLGAEFNAFLFEPIGADDRGRQVTVVSALARLDMDPWAEADRLSRLPDETAARSISMIFSRLPEIALAIADRPQHALRLVRLLPKRLAGIEVKTPFIRAVTPTASRRAVMAGLFCAVALLMLGQMLWRSDHAAPHAPPTPITAQSVPVPHAKVGD